MEKLTMAQMIAQVNASVEVSFPHSRIDWDEIDALERQAEYKITYFNNDVVVKLIGAS